MGGKKRGRARKVLDSGQPPISNADGEAPVGTLIGSVNGAAAGSSAGPEASINGAAAGSSGGLQPSDTLLSSLHGAWLSTVNGEVWTLLPNQVTLKNGVPARPRERVKSGRDFGMYRDDGWSVDAPSSSKTTLQWVHPLSNNIVLWTKIDEGGTPPGSKRSGSSVPAPLSEAAGSSDPAALSENTESRPSTAEPEPGLSIGESAERRESATDHTVSGKRPRRALAISAYAEWKESAERRESATDHTESGKRPRRAWPSLHPREKEAADETAGEAQGADGIPSGSSSSGATATASTDSGAQATASTDSGATASTDSGVRADPASLLEPLSKELSALEGRFGLPKTAPSPAESSPAPSPTELIPSTAAEAADQYKAQYEDGPTEVPEMNAAGDSPKDDAIDSMDILCSGCLSLLLPGKAGQTSPRYVVLTKHKLIWWPTESDFRSGASSHGQLEIKDIKRVSWSKPANGFTVCAQRIWVSFAADGGLRELKGWLRPLMEALEGFRKGSRDVGTAGLTDV